jgi:hypothetical protein
MNGTKVEAVARHDGEVLRRAVRDELDRVVHGRSYPLGLVVTLGMDDPGLHLAARGALLMLQAIECDSPPVQSNEQSFILVVGNAIAGGQLRQPESQAKKNGVTYSLGTQSRGHSSALTSAASSKFQ